MELDRQNPVVQHYRQLMWFFFGLYLIGGVLFFVIPDTLFQVMNWGSERLQLANVAPLPVERFWLVLTVSMMMMLSGLSFLSAKDPLTRGYPAIHILSKLVSTAGFLLMFFLHERYFVYLVGIATDFPIALVMIWSLLRLSKQVSTRL